MRPSPSPATIADGEPSFLPVSLHGYSDPVRYSDQYFLMTQIAWMIPGM